MFYSRSLVILFFIGLVAGAAFASTPQAQLGVLDLSGLSSDQFKGVQLNGGWSFIPELIEPDHWEYTKAYVLSTPGVWADAQGDRNVFGSGTYRLKVLLGGEHRPLYLSVPVVNSATQVFQGNKLIWQQGGVGVDRGAYHPNWKGGTLLLRDVGEELVLTVQVSNFDHFRGGVLSSFVLGESQYMEVRKILILSFELFVLSSLLILGVNSLVLSFYGSNEKISFYFGVICLLFSARQLGSGEILNLGFWDGHFEFLLKLRNLPDILALSAFVFYVRELFPQELNKLFFWVLQACCLWIGLAVLLLPVAWFSYVLPVGELVTGVSVIYGLWVGFIALKNRRVGAFGYSFSFLLFAPTVINDILYANGFIQTHYLAPFGMLLFLLSQSVVIHRKYSFALESVEKLSVKLEKQNHKLLELDQLKDQFLANTSHELRSPLQGIIGLIDSFPKKQWKLLPQEAQNNLGLIGQSAQRLSHLVNDLLDLTQIREGRVKVHLTAVDLKTTVEWILQLCAPLAKPKGLNLSHSIPEGFPAVHADEARLSQILYNLVWNGIKFTEKGGVTLRVSQDGKMVRITVQDTGVGVSPEQASQVFEPFYQADGRLGRSNGGTGLGLSISKDLVELQNGHIEIHSAEGAGSSVVVCLPISKQPARPNPNPEHLAPAPSQEPSPCATIPVKSGPHTGVLVMVVDDEAASRQSQVNLLTEAGYLVHAFDNGMAALEQLDQGVPQLVVTDLMMPNMNGLELTETIREKYDALELPIILVTAFASTGTQQSAVQFGANDYITKPFDGREFLVRVDSQIQMCALKREQTKLALLGAPEVKALRKLLVESLNFALEAWGETTGKSKVSLAEESGLWNVYLDGMTYKTRTLDRYLKLTTLPKKPRCSDLLDTLCFVLKLETLSPDTRKKLQAYKDDLSRLMAC